MRSISPETCMRWFQALLPRQADFFEVDIDVEVRDARHLTLIAAALRACPPVETVDRAKG
jgi:(p)ppGpp synthase/HD superfamily hydrolase